MSFFSAQKSVGTQGQSVECDILYCHSCTEKTMIWKLHRKWYLIDGNKHPTELTTVKPIPIRGSFEYDMHLNHASLSIFW